MLSEKQPGRHPTAGTIYYWCLSLVFVSATALSMMRWAQDYHLFILGALSFIAATTGREARRDVGVTGPGYISLAWARPTCC